MRQAKLGASCGVEVPAEQGLTHHSYRVWQRWRKSRGKADRHRCSGHREPRSPPGSPHSPKRETAPSKRRRPRAMGFTPQQPTQRQRLGERPAGLPGSTVERGRCGEQRQARGRPGGFQLAGPPGHGIRILSHAWGKPATPGKPDPKPRRKRQPVGHSNHEEPGRYPPGSQIRL